MQDALEMVHLQGVLLGRGALAAGQQPAGAVELEDGEHEGELEEGAKDGGRDAADRPAHPRRRLTGFSSAICPPPCP